MDVRQLRYFLAVVDHGSVNKAAAALHVAQPSLSQAIRALERDLGLDLFRRVGRKLVLTDAGEALIAPARQVVRGLATARASVNEVAGLRVGRVEIAAMPSQSVEPLARMIKTVTEQHPGLSISVRAAFTADDVVLLAIHVVHLQAELGGQASAAAGLVRRRRVAVPPTRPAAAIHPASNAAQVGSHSGWPSRSTQLTPNSTRTSATPRSPPDVRTAGSAKIRSSHWAAVTAMPSSRPAVMRCQAATAGSPVSRCSTSSPAAAVSRARGRMTRRRSMGERYPRGPPAHTPGATSPVS